ncbi:MAG: heme-copper oxidase subunit III [Anaerolineales bacterium]|nr:heme-copper oxidase subunit III [Anaerolineales bacterium]
MVVHSPPSLGLDNRKFGFWCFIASEVLFFSVLIANFLVLSKQDPAGSFHGVATGRELLNIPLTALNTFILLTSSFTVVLALEAIQKGNQKMFRIFLLVTLAFGSFFIGVQGYEYFILIVHEGLNMGTLFGASFFTLTGFHGAHVVGGLIWLVIIMFKAFGVMGGFSAQDNLGIEIFGLYWHFVDIVWLLLFSLVYLI